MLRFPPGGPEEIKRIRDEAKWTHRKRPTSEQSGTWYRLSTWVDVPAEGESTESLKLRLIHSAGLNGIRLADVRNAHFWWARAGDLYDRGFLLKKDGVEDEAREHWSVDLGSEPPSVDTVKRFVAAFTGPERTARDDDQ